MAFVLGSTYGVQPGSRSQARSLIGYRDSTAKLFSRANSCKHSIKKSLTGTRSVKIAATNRPGNTGHAGFTNVERVETTEERIASLIAANDRLLARIAELEKVAIKVSEKNSSYVKDVTATLSSKAKEVTSAKPMTTVESKPAVASPPSAAQAAMQVLSQLANITWPSPNDEVPFWKKAPNLDVDMAALLPDTKDLGPGKKIAPDRNISYIVHVTAEVAPVAKVGGLGDVVTGLGRACIERGHKVLVMLPFYECIDTTQVEGLTEADSFSSFHKGAWLPVKTFHGKVAGVPLLLIRPENNFFKGNQIYGGAYNEMEAYLFFSRTCLERMQITGDQPDVIHIHDWHIGVLAMLYWDVYHHLSLKKPRIVLTIHNMEHYGECRIEQLTMCGLVGSTYGTIEKAVDERTIGHNPQRLSLLKGGIVYSNAVTTVSPTYAQETLCSGWMATTLMRHRSKYSGILNGIDTTIWDPANDASLPMQYDAQLPFGKLVCKQYVQRGLGLDADDLIGDGTPLLERKRTPLVICITRLVAQKGIHLLRHAINQIGDRGGQFILLGTAPDPRIQAEFEYLGQQLRNSKSTRLLHFYSEELAHMLYAAGDIVLVPSMFEPCGLTQMIGMRYGAIPVVRRTGGLADTVFDVDDLTNRDKGNGFVFDGISEDSLDSALNRALNYYKERPEWWQDLTVRDMQLDHSWNKSAEEYVNLYNSVRV